MAVAELLTELNDARYAGLSVKECASLLNEWQTDYVPCLSHLLRAKLDDLLVIERVNLAREKGVVDDDLWLRWQSLLKLVEAEKEVAFDAGPVFAENLFQTLGDLGVLTDPEPTWLMDLGRRRWTKARILIARDITEDDITKAESLRVLHEKVVSRRDEVRAEYEVKVSEVQRASDEVQKTDDSLQFIGDASYVPDWEK